MTVVPDDKDWTWVLERRCDECCFDATSVDPRTVAGALRENADAFMRVLSRDDALLRPEPDVWSPTEYACHVRDVHRVFADRVQRMLHEDDPQLASWDQDRAAVEQRYAEQHPAEVAPQLVEAAFQVAGLYDRVLPGEWARTGRRDDGSVFTVGTLAAYHLHDVVHHLHDLER